MPVRRPVLLLLAAACLPAAACSPIERYTRELTDERYGRTWFTRFPAGVGGTLGFVIGVPIDLVAMPLTWVVYRTQPKETRDVMSTFLFPSYALWKAGSLLGTPFDGVEWIAWRSWQPPRPISQEEREAIEHSWDEAGWSEYPVVPIYPVPPAPAPSPQEPPRGG